MGEEVASSHSCLSTLHIGVDLICFPICFNRYPSLHSSISEFPKTVSNLLVPSLVSSRVTFQGAHNGNRGSIDVIPFPAFSTTRTPKQLSAFPPQTTSFTGPTSGLRARSFQLASVSVEGNNQPTQIHGFVRAERNGPRWPHITATCGRLPSTERPARWHSARMTSEDNTMSCSLPFAPQVPENGLNAMMPCQPYTAFTRQLRQPIKSTSRRLNL